ncbi:MAG: glycosyltransferase family 2 protein, partial [Thaumarchaeota archaeon]|nr:glycosyltransferase family 2 protein [Nitrososphaerota archaeon]
VMRGFHNDKVQGATGTVLPLDQKTRTQNARLVEYLLGVPSKTAQAKMSGIWTLAGCCMMWKTKFLKKIGVRSDTVVEDMDVSWSTQASKDPDGDHYKLGYNPKAVAYTAEPETFKQYVKQTDRWMSVKPVLKKSFSGVSKSLKAFTTWVFAESVVPFLWIALAAWLLLTGSLLALGVMLLFDLLTLTAISAYMGRKYGYGLRRILKGVGWFWVYRFVNAFQFWRRLIKPKKKWQ